jgi:hypothetical protein
MSFPRSASRNRLPAWLVLGGSVAVSLHLFAVIILALASPSGPWPTPFGTSMAAEPAFAQRISTVTTRSYLAPLKMTHNYHFATNRPVSPGVYLEVRLKDATGEILQVVRIPDKKANFWVRHRQTLLAQALADDQPIEPRPGEVIPAPHQQVQEITIWDLNADRTLRLRSVPEHLVPRDRPVSRPSPWSLLLARSYGRYLCRVHNASSAELLRHTREPILPAIMFLDETPPNTFDELIANFGEFPR